MPASLRTKVCRLTKSRSGLKASARGNFRAPPARPRRISPASDSKSSCFDVSSRHIHRRSQQGPSEVRSAVTAKHAGCQFLSQPFSILVFATQCLPETDTRQKSHRTVSVARKIVTASHHWYRGSVRHILSEHLVGRLTRQRPRLRGGHDYSQRHSQYRFSSMLHLLWWRFG